ncbi:hypothetical protein TNCV_593091 [Trichonephila clavipes]|nr:hypothetical protein TNCV_593091 [Trichonephila clavipes]
MLSEIPDMQRIIPSVKDIQVMRSSTEGTRSRTPNSSCDQNQPHVTFCSLHPTISGNGSQIANSSTVRLDETFRSGPPIARLPGEISENLVAVNKPPTFEPRSSHEDDTEAVLPLQISTPRQWKEIEPRQPKYSTARMFSRTIGNKGKGWRTPGQVREFFPKIGVKRIKAVLSESWPKRQTHSDPPCCY